MDKFTIIQDTREQYAWDFSFYERCQGVVIEKLHTGDYSIKGLETIVTLERKRTTGEIALNVGKDRVRFTDELLRMKEFKYKYLLCEFSLEDLQNFPKNSTIPRSRWPGLRMNAKYLTSCLLSYKEEYDIDVYFCGNRDGANQKAIELLEYVYEIENQNKKMV